MKSKYIIFAILLILAIILIWVYYSYNHKLTNNTTTIMTNQTVHFTSPNNQFSFDYPIFEKWNVSLKASEIDYAPAPDAGFNAFQPYKVTMQEIMMKVTADFWDKQTKNAKGVPYIVGSAKDNNGNTTLTFRLSNSSIEVSIPKSSSNQGFDGNKVWNMILNSFETK